MLLVGVQHWREAHCAAPYGELADVECRVAEENLGDRVTYGWEDVGVGRVGEWCVELFVGERVDGGGEFGLGGVEFV